LTSRHPEPLRVLAVTQIFPNSVEPTFGIFNGHQFEALARLCELDLRAVILWFPGVALLAPRSVAGLFARVPRAERFGNLPVRHPRVLYVPVVGRALSPALYAASLWPQVRRLRGRVDVVLGSWAWPDGVAALVLAHLLGAACVVKAHGSDLNVLGASPLLRPLLRLALPHADRLVAVSRPLAEKAIGLGVSANRTVVVQNGVDRETFRPRPRAAARVELGQSPEGRFIVYVGRLERTKGIFDLMEAFARLAPDHPDTRLVLVGGGSQAEACSDFAARHRGRVITTGSRLPPEVALWVSASDVLALPSWNEGAPNVILEAFASGRRVVATRVGGLPDLVTSDLLGELVPVRNATALAAALIRALETPYDSEPIVRAAPFSWSESASCLLEVLETAAGRRGTVRLR
jgi:teichuronic acid biosynthesis glycosyltransferase TuaC